MVSIFQIEKYIKNTFNRCDFDCFRLVYLFVCLPCEPSAIPIFLLTSVTSSFSGISCHPEMECSLSGPEIGSFSTYLESYGCCESIYVHQHRWDMVGWSSDISIYFYSTYLDHPNLWAPRLHIHIIHGCEVMFDPDWNAQLHGSLLQTHPKLWSQGQRYWLDNGTSWRNVNCFVWDRQNKWTVLSTHV
jgi:hypothetical protein